MATLLMISQENDGNSVELGMVQFVADTSQSPFPIPGMRHRRSGELDYFLGHFPAQVGGLWEILASGFFAKMLL